MSPSDIRADVPALPAPEEVKALPPPEGTPPPRRRGMMGWLIALLLMAGIAWLIWRLLFGGPAHRHTAQSAEPVGVAKIATGNMQVVLTGLGTVTPVATVTVQTQISGQLMSVGFTEGQIVKQGDFLAQIDPRPYQVALEQAQGTLARDQALLAQAKSDLLRYIALNRQDSIAKQQVADQQYLVQQDAGTVKVDQAAIDSAKLNLTYCHITAPVTGRVGLRLVDPGNYVQTSGSTGLLVLTQLQPITVIFVLPEDDIPAIAAEMNAGHALVVDAYDRTNTTVIATGTLLTMDNTVDTTTGTVKLRASFPNTNNALFPNEFVNARLMLQTLQNVVEAPTAAVQHGAPGTFVYVVKPDSTVAVQVIGTGITDGDMVQVTSGLKAGDTVVVDGTDQLKQGAKVKVAPDQGDAAATQQSSPGAPPGQQPANATPVPGKHHRHHHQQGNQ